MSDSGQAKRTLSIPSLLLERLEELVGYFGTCAEDSCVWNKGKPEDYCQGDFVKPKKEKKEE